MITPGQLSTINPQLLLAELPAPDSYHAVGWIILVLGGIAGLVLVGLQIVKTSREIRAGNDPQNIRVANPSQKREVTFPPAFTTVEQCHDEHERVNKELAAIRADIVARDKASSESRKNIHDQLTRMEKDISTLTERSANTNGWLQTMDQKLSDVTEGLANVAGRIK